MANFSGPGLGSAVKATVVKHNSRADPSGKSHIEERKMTTPCSMGCFTQCPHVRVIVDDHRYFKHFTDTLYEWEVLPSGDMGGKRDALVRKIDRPAEADPASFKVRPSAGDRADLRQHPLGAAFPVGGARFAANDFRILKQRYGKLGAAHVDGESIHRQSVTLEFLFTRKS